MGRLRGSTPPSAARPRPTVRLAAVRRVRRQLRAWRRPRTRSSTCIRNAWRAVQRIDDRPIDPRPYAFEPNHLFQVADKGEDGIARVQRELDLALADGRPQPRSGRRFLNKWIPLSGCRFGVPRAQTMCVSTLCTDGGPENPCESKGPLSYWLFSRGWRRGRDPPPILSAPPISPRKAAIAAGYGILRGLRHGLLFLRRIHQRVERSTSLPKSPSNSISSRPLWPWLWRTGDV
jgi:hypothetical protein